MIKIILFYLLFFNYIVLISQEKKTLNATKINSQIKIDGILNEPEWLNTEAAKDFIQTAPTFRNNFVKNTIVKILYDNEAIYISAFMENENPKNIAAQLTERDKENNQNTDLFAVGFDTYFDKQNAFIFMVTPMGVQSDFKYGENVNIKLQDGSNVKEDRSWDAVWENSCRIVENGWIAEIKIPFSVLRFTKKDIQTWGVQFYRFSQQSQERDYWNEMNPQNSNIVSQFGELKNLKNIKPPFRLFLYPNISTGITNNPNENNTYTRSYPYNIGMDFKYGINESYTIDMTLIPDFGQVVSDNKVLNISPFEQVFDEKRPFFTEGADLFSKSNIFYSRRIGKIGKTPELYSKIIDSLKNNEEIISNNKNIQLINATKLTGRGSNGLAIGFLNAITKQTEAIIRNNQTLTQNKIISEPLTNYNIFVLDKSLKNSSSITFANSNVLREGNFRKANVTSLNAKFYNHNQEYSLSFGNQWSLIYHPQNNPNNYLIGYDNNLQIGNLSSISFGKISGKWQFNIESTIATKKYDINDLGINQLNNFNYNGIDISRLYNTPKNNVLKHIHGFGINNFNQLSKFIYGRIESYQYNEWTFKNFYILNLQFFGMPFWSNNFYESRTENRIMRQTSFLYTQLQLTTDQRKKLNCFLQIGFAESELPNDPYVNFIIKPSLRISQNSNISWRFALEHNQAGYGYATTYSDSIFISPRLIKTFSNTINFNFLFSQFSIFTLQLRHYWSSVQYPTLYLLNNNGNWDNKDYAIKNNLNKNYNTFTVDANYSWQFKRGSFLNITWKNYVNSESIIDVNLNSYLHNVDTIFNNYLHSNELYLKFIYFLDVQKTFYNNFL